MSIVETILESIDELNKATEAYNTGHPVMTDKEWDDRYFHLQEMEKTWGIVYAHSPTQTIHYETKDILAKVKHNHEMLSLEKTKDTKVISGFLGSHAAVAMCKMDGLTCTLTYEDGKLISAETRGDGFIGEDILHNAKIISSIPIHIPASGKVVVDGEIICDIKTFNEHFADEYENPRNFASGSIRLLSSKESASRKLTFVAWDAIEGIDKELFSEKLLQLEAFGFTVVPYYSVDDIENVISLLQRDAKSFGYPIDGIVFKFNDVAYGKSLGKTSHHFKNAMAYKFYDEVVKTRLISIEYTMGRTGVLTPIAIFEPVKLEGTTIERASLHNLSVMREMFGDYPYTGQTIEVFKANQIIPQIYKAYDIVEDGSLADWQIPLLPPDRCPICGKEVKEITEIDSTVLKCMNDACEGKLINRFDHYCGKKGMDIKGLSKMTLAKLIDWGWLGNLEELYSLSNFRDEWIEKPGFGEKSVDKILNAIESSRQCNLDQFIAALGIPIIGATAAKELIKHFHSWNEFYEAIQSNYEFYNLPNFGYEMYTSIMKFNYEEANRIANHYLKFNNVETIVITEDTLKDKIFVITGTLNNFKNREELTKLILSLGGKVSTSISGKTNYLINNDINSTSSKNRAAKSKNIPILTEEDFLEMAGIK